MFENYTKELLFVCDNWLEKQVRAWVRRESSGDNMDKETGFQ